MTDWKATALEEKYSVRVIDSDCPGGLRYIIDDSKKGVAISSGKVFGDMIYLSKKQIKFFAQEFPQILRDHGIYWEGVA